MSKLPRQLSSGLMSHDPLRKPLVANSQLGNGRCYHLRNNGAPSSLPEMRKAGFKETTTRIWLGTMRAWIAFRDEEELAKKEKEEDMKALDVRRERLHELETERLGLTDVCRYETMVEGEEEEIGPQGVETSEHEHTNGDRSNPISLEDTVEEDPRQPPPDDHPPAQTEPTELNERSKHSDPVAPIVELLRKQQREEREEADIRREEQVLLNKRLAMMEEQVQMLSKLITQREQRSQPVSPPQPADATTSESTELSTQFEVEAGPVDTSRGADAPIEIAEDSPDVPMGEAANIPGETTAGSGTGAVVTSEGNDAPSGTVEHHTNLSMDEIAESTGDNTAGSGTAAADTSESDGAPAETVNILQTFLAIPQLNLESQHRTARLNHRMMLPIPPGPRMCPRPVKPKLQLAMRIQWRPQMLQMAVTTILP